MAQSNNDDWLSIKGPFNSGDISKYSSYDHIEKLSLTKNNLVTVKTSNGFKSLKSVKWLWLWCSVTRTAMRNVIAIPNLEVVDILEIKHPGKLINFEEADKLREFRCNHYMTEADLIEISKLPVLEELGAQNSAITPKILETLLSIQTLEAMDFEATLFNDTMASIVAKSKTIKRLDIGASKLTSKGLGEISRMEQLQSLDIWANDINETDLELLCNLPELKYLSIGGVDEQTLLTSKGVLPRLYEIPSLKKVWLDGISITECEKKELEERYEYFRN